MEGAKNLNSNYLFDLFNIRVGNLHQLPFIRVLCVGVGAFWTWAGVSLVF